jgi:prepilin-type N-terminal cleavage/methylation domain-containing protein
MQPNAMPRRDGFTLLEILITIIIFTLGVVIIAGLFSTGLATSVDAENTNVAVSLTQRRLEEIKNLDFETGIVNESKASVSGFTGFQRQVVVTEPETDLKQVTVTTYWNFKDSEVNTSMVMYISKN